MRRLHAMLFISMTPAVVLILFSIYKYANERSHPLTEAVAKDALLNHYVTMSQRCEQLMDLEMNEMVSVKEIKSGRKCTVYYAGRFRIDIYNRSFSFVPNVGDNSKLATEGFFYQDLNGQWKVEMTKFSNYGLSHE